MGGVTDHVFQIAFFEGFQRFRICVGFLEAAQNFSLLRVFDFPAVDQFVAMIIKPAGKALSIFRRQGLDGGLQLLHAHMRNLRFPKPIASPNGNCELTRLASR